jgi:hypothetical protein
MSAFLQMLKQSIDASSRLRVVIRHKTAPTLVLCVGIFFSFLVSGCANSPGGVADGYASAEVQTWQDTNGDGEQDPGEPPLPWVTIQMDYERSVTDSKGRGTLVLFKPGCARQCWKGEAVLAQLPRGYRATTPTEMDLSRDEQVYAFGFRPEVEGKPVAFPDEPDWSEAFLNRGLEPVVFHYADGGRLSLSFDATGGRDEDAFYRDIFDLIFTLEKIEGISVDGVEIGLTSAEDVAVCDMEQVAEWSAKLPPTEIVSAYCQPSQTSTAIPTVTHTVEPPPTHTPKPAGTRPIFEGNWCFESEQASFDLQLEQTGQLVSGTFFLLKYCEVGGERNACRIREGEVNGTVEEDKTEVAVIIPEYDEEGGALLSLDQGSLSWQVTVYSQEFYLPAQFKLSRCGD